MDKRKIKKLLILNLPYFLVGLFATNLGEALRLAEGADSSADCPPERISASPVFKPPVTS